MDTTIGSVRIHNQEREDALLDQIEALRVENESLRKVIEERNLLVLKLATFIVREA